MHAKRFSEKSKDRLTKTDSVLTVVLVQQFTVLNCTRIESLSSHLTPIKLELENTDLMYSELLYCQSVLIILI